MHSRIPLTFFSFGADFLKNRINLHPGCTGAVLRIVKCASFAIGTKAICGRDARMSNFNYGRLMEQINRIELLGIVGSVRLQYVAGKRMAKFTLVTNRAYKNKEGAPVIETQWHNVTAFEGKKVQCLEHIEKGMAVHVWGHLQVQRVAGADGTDRTYVDVICHKLVIEDQDEEIQYEM